MAFSPFFRFCFRHGAAGKYSFAEQKDDLYATGSDVTIKNEAYMAERSGDDESTRYVTLKFGEVDDDRSDEETHMWYQGN